MTTATVEAAPQATLTVQDRCDECGSQAYIHVTMPVGELLFCAHHGNKYRAKLEEKAVSFIDETWQLSDKRLDVSA